MIRSSAIWDTGRTPLHSRSVLILDIGVVYGHYLCVCGWGDIFADSAVGGDFKTEKGKEG